MVAQISRKKIIKKCLWLGVVTHTYNPSTKYWDPETRGLLRVQDQPGLHSWLQDNWVKKKDKGKVI